MLMQAMNFQLGFNIILLALENTLKLISNLIIKYFKPGSSA